MELVEANNRVQVQALRQRRDLCPCNVKCIKRYVQPAREKSFAPERVYNPPTNPLETYTTYHASYLDMDRSQIRLCRSQPVRPTAALQRSNDKFAAETTNQLSYKPVWAVVKARPILQRQRTMTGTGQMESVTTARQDFGPKCIDRQDIIIPCGNIRISKGRLEDRTTAKLSYGSPGAVEPTTNFKPVRIYTAPTEPIPSETTQKLSYQPVPVEKREVCPWQEKRPYRPPASKMCEKTTYSESFFKNARPRMEKPFIPVPMNIFPYGAEFADRTIYKSSFLESKPMRVEPILPSNSISVAEGRISSDTTNKLSFQPVYSEKRESILPRSRNMIGDGPMESETTNRRDFMPKAALKAEPIIPCSNIRTPETPFEDGTTSKLSYINPGPAEIVQSFKPLAHYQRPDVKIDFDTINKLSYQQWNLPAESEKKGRLGKKREEYHPPKERMCADTVYHMSFAAPGHYVQVDSAGGDQCSSRNTVEKDE